MTWPTWEQLKQGGSDHYHRGEIQPIDLYKTHPEAFHHWAVIESMQHLWLYLPFKRKGGLVCERRFRMLLLQLVR